jgi:hypothetical protein
MKKLLLVAVLVLISTVCVAEDAETKETVVREIALILRLMSLLEREMGSA